MAEIKRNFTRGIMNKSLDEKLVPNGEYIDAVNIRVGESSQNDRGAVSNVKGNVRLSTLAYNGEVLSNDALVIGSTIDIEHNTIYWLVHDPSFPGSFITGKLDLVVSFNTDTNIITYHLTSIKAADSTTETTLNFNPKYLVTGIKILDDMLLFTDNYNPIRRIYTDQSYNTPPVFSSDNFTSAQISLIRKPPSNSPLVEPLKMGGDSNFLEDRFISFAYRYKYYNNEFSATSQWSHPAFVPSFFSFGTDTFLNNGMLNTMNAANITFNSGDKLVIGIDILFKESGTNFIKVIEQIDKEEAGYSNNTDYTYLFTNSKIFTILPEAEILRTSDSVPNKAKALTIMGNRLVLGNYEEGRDMVDANGSPVRIGYTLEHIDEEVGAVALEGSLSTGSYAWTGENIDDSVISIDFGNASLIQGATLTIDLQFTHSAFSGDTPYPTEDTFVMNLTFSYLLTQNYVSIYELVQDPAFQTRVGSDADAADIADACLGTTWIDQFNCSTLNTLDALLKQFCGIGAANTTLKVTSPGVGSSIMEVQIPATSYVDDLTTPTFTVYEYLKINNANAQFQELGNTRSLHSNRGYEIVMIYMDEYKRESFALESQNNTLYLPCSSSINKNSIQITIPTDQHAPEWADSFKFAIRADKAEYETIYSKLILKDSASNDVWFLLEGEQARKVEKGDILIVKVDTQGAVQNCTEVSVLEKEAKEEDFITPITANYVPTGVYMKIQTNGFSIEKDPNSTVQNPKSFSCATNSGAFTRSDSNVSIVDPADPTQWVDYTIPAGSVIKIDVDTGRRGTGAGGTGGCSRRDYHLHKTLVATTDYNDFYSWFIGDNIGALVNTGTSELGDPTSAIYNVFIPGIVTNSNNLQAGSLVTNYYQFYRDPSDNALYFVVSGTLACGSLKGRKACTSVQITVNRTLDTVVFETKPADTVPDLALIGTQSYDIDSNGFHNGNVQDQTATVPAIIKSEFANCFSFGNGVESYKVRDSAIGKTFPFGSQATSSENKEYEAVSRDSDLTYSGVYNDESNVNRLNEFNAGQFNFKHLEDSFGSVQLIDGRETDIRVLHSDKITYVLAGKNLLSDATGGSVVTSVPEVLGTQIARIEEFGISFNPEGYATWGNTTFFPDEKRGVVIMLRGETLGSEAISIISNQGLRNWFKELFKANKGTQKIGGYDPFTDEYILSTNDRGLPSRVEAVGPGSILDIPIFDGDDYSYDVELPFTVGGVDVDFEVDGLSEFSIRTLYNELEYTTGRINTSGKLTFPKTEPYVTNVNVKIEALSGDLNIRIVVNEPEPTELTVVPITLSSGEQIDFTTNNFQWALRESVSPIETSRVTLLNSNSNEDLISQYSPISGGQGAGMIPPDGSTITMKNLKLAEDTFILSTASNRFRYLRTDTVYGDNMTDMLSLVAAAVEMEPIEVTPTEYKAQFDLPGTGEYLYLVYDYR